ncbi:MAG: class I SAM-dependent methyltransferase [Solirubrobacteraceae bacterium]
MRLIGPPEADGEYVGLREAGAREEIIHLHDYERIYDVPGLYEHIVQRLLRCRSPQIAISGLAHALDWLRLEPAEIVLFDLGAGTGVVGELASGLGVRTIVGVDALEAARAACLRDRPLVYRDYIIGDLAAPAPGLLAQLRRHRPTALISAGAFGGTHAPPATLLSALALLPPGAPVVFTIDERWMQTDGPGGFRAPITGLITSGRLRLLRRSRFQHRLSTTGNPIHYELLVAATASVGPDPLDPSSGSGAAPSAPD